MTRETMMGQGNEGKSQVVGKLPNEQKKVVCCPSPTKANNKVNIERVTKPR